MIKETTRSLSDETIRRFLLGDLQASEQTAFEHLLFTDGDLEERVRLAELELSDDHAADRLTVTERDLFRQRFLLTADRRSELAVSTALHGNFATAPSIAYDSWWQSVTNSFDLRRHAWKYAFAAATFILLLLATALLVKKERVRLVDDSSRPQRVAPRPSATTSPRVTNHSTNPPAPAHSETPPVLPMHEVLTTSVVLSSDVPLDAAPAISAPHGVIRVELTLSQPVAEYYDVALMTIAGDSVFSANGLKRLESETIGFHVPSDAVPPGDYQVNLLRIDGESKQNAGTYYFHVR